MQSRVEQMPARLVPDSFEYRLARAKLRAASGSPTSAVEFFRSQLEDKTVLRPREDVYGLALALRRARDFESAEREIAALRSAEGSHPAFDLVWAQLQADQGRSEEALKAYREALKSNPGHRGLVHGYADLLISSGKTSEAIAWLGEKVRSTPDDARLYELQSRAYAATGNRLAQHRAQAEAYYRRGNLAAAVNQLDMATKVRGSDYYELSMADARLRELRSQLEIEREAEKALKIS